MAQYRINVLPGARRDLHRIRDYIAKDKPRAAEKWWRQATKHIQSLTSNPFRYEITPEAEYLGANYRHYIFGNYRIIYYVVGDEVSIAHIIPASRLLEIAWEENDS